MRAITAVVVAGVLLACGSSSNGGSSGTGTSIALSGSPNITGTLNQATAIVVDNKACTTSSVALHASAAVIVFSTVSNACQLLQQNAQPANTTAALVVLARIGTGASVPLATGTYTWFDVNSGGIPPLDLTTQTASLVVAGTAAKNGAAATGGGCTLVEGANVTGGTVTVSSSTSSAVVGTVDLQLSNGGAIKGSFNAPLCSTGADINSTCDVTGITLDNTGPCR